MESSIALAPARACDCRHSGANFFKKYRKFIHMSENCNKSGGLDLLCDEMLALLARWLRAAGYDTALVEDGRTDIALLAKARAEGRVLLTCDRALAARAGKYGVEAVPVDSAPLEDQVAAVTEALGIDWVAAPFSRCLVDNAPVRPATAAEVARLPPDRPGVPPPYTACPYCGRVYWAGGHVQRMRRRLQRWAVGDFSPPAEDGANESAGGDGPSGA